MARQLSAEEVAIFRECFNEYDQDRGGNISVEEFGRVMRKTNPSIADEEVSKIISEVDLDGDGTINFDEFITMMTGQPYKSPEAAAAPAAAQEAPAQAAAATDDDGTQTTSTTETTTLGTSQEPAPALVSPSAAAFRGVSTVSARLRRQRLANQLYKDAWAAVDPSLGRALTPRELRDQVAPRAGLEAGDLTDADLEAMMGGGSLPADGEEGTITYTQFLDFAKRQEVDDIVSGYGA